MEKLTYYVTKVAVLALFAGLLMLPSCSTDVQQEEISLKGKKVTDSFKKAVNKSSLSADENSSVEVYEVNTKSPKAEIVKEKLTSILKDSLNESSEDNGDLSSLNDPGLEEPNMDDAYIREDTETEGRQALVTPIEDGDNTTRIATVSGYDEATNSIEKTVTVTVDGNYSAAEVEANPDLAEQAELDVTIKAQNGEVLFSHTYTADNYNDPPAKTIAGGPVGCYIDCMTNIGYLSTWEQIYLGAIGPIAANWASSSVVGALLTAAAIIGVHSGCFYGCLAQWIWLV